MTGRDDVSHFNIGRPALGRWRVGALRLVLTFSLAPLAWSIQLAAVATIGGVCASPGGQAMIQQPPGWVDPATVLINLGALAVASSGLLLSILNITKASQTTDEPRGGIVMAGEGRVHWMALGAVFCSLLFITAIAFNTVAVFWQGLCAL